MKWRGGFVPVNPHDPARSLISWRVRSLGRGRHRTAPRFTAAVEKRRDARSRGLLDPRGYTPLFLVERSCGPLANDRATGAHAGDERAGRVMRTDSVRSRLSAPSGLFAKVSSNYTKMSSREAAVLNLAMVHRSKSPAIASSRLHGRPSLDRSPTSPVPFC
jgi:hypothetical protein